MVNAVKISDCVGVKEILLWRFTATILWSVVSQILILILCIFLVNFNLSPLRWIQSTIYIVLTPTTLFYLLPLILIIFAQGVICSKEYVSYNTYHSTRFATVLSLLSFKNVWLGSLHVVSGGLTAWSYVSLVGNEYSEPYRKCKENNSNCFIEGYVFLLLNGFWIGIYYFVTEYLFTVKNITFPVTQQNKFLQIKSSLSGLMFKASSDAILPTFYFLFIYYFYGYLVTNFCISLFEMEIESSSNSVMPDFVDMNLILYGWFFSTLFLLAMYLMKLLFEVNLTTHHVFPIASHTPDIVTIGDAMTMEAFPIIRHLACFDLFMLAASDKNRRRLIFLLSQPGGHPYNWNNVVTPSLTIINDFALELTRALENSKPTVDSIKSMKLVESQIKSAVSKETFPNITSSLYEPHIGSPFVPRHRLRNMLLKTDYDHLSKPIIEKTQPKESMSDMTENILKTLLDRLRKKPGINYLFGEQPDMKIKHNLSQGQLIIWTVQALSWLSTCSFAEDSYGVVQKDLPIIISTLLKLKNILDKVSKSGFLTVNRKVNQNRKENFYIQMLASLKCATKRSLYNICNTFGPFIDDISLESDSLLQIKMFLSHKES